ncbi:MAG: CHAT domain-containing protein [Symploca sp. SIO2E9]|nr:CHAT domain-containing protein [Symploca sp. SIO2E9]
MPFPHPSKKMQFKCVSSYIWLGLLTLLLITIVSPAVAQYSQLSPRAESYTEAPTQLEKGKTFYQGELFSEAAAVWQQAAQAYQTQGDRFNQSLSLSYLSLAYQELGQWQAAETAITQSLDILKSQPSLDERGLAIVAQTLNTQGSLQLAMGTAETALKTWKQAAQVYAEIGDQAGSIGSEINQAQALQTLGMYRRAQITLERVRQKLQAQPDSLIKAKGLQSLGVALQVLGNLEESQEVLEQSLEISQQLNSTANSSEILFSLANTARDLQDYQKASRLYQQVAANTTNPFRKVEAQLNHLSLIVQITDSSDSTEITSYAGEEVKALLPKIQSQLLKLPPSRRVVYAQVNLAETMIKIGNGQELSNHQEIAQLLARAVAQARMLQDARAESSALGELGRLYEHRQQWADAQEATQEALLLAQGVSADDIAYRWQWQLGRILQQLKKLNEAVVAYADAVNTLEFLRGDLLAINPEVQFSFRESVEPVYRQLVGLLLQPAIGNENTKGAPSQKNLEKAREVIESLQLAQLENFFREACLDAKPEQIDKVDATAAVIYPIILPDRLAVILSLPEQPLHYYETRLPEAEVQSILEQLLQSLNPAFSNRVRLRLSQQVYDWLIRPAEVNLVESEAKTLVFILDGALRNLPMAALYDGQNYLLQKYNVALSQGLQLPEPRTLPREGLKVLTGGLTEARQGFSPLPAVEFEVNQIASELPTEILLNQKFTKTTLQTQIQAAPFRVVHLATHGQFSSQADETFLLTWDSRINVKDLDQLLHVRERDDSNPIELLVLSACQTAEGDKQATLGLAGIALRSGARSTLATLWSVQDESTAELMAEFYRELSQAEVSKASALRQAQLSLLQEPQYEHPFYWAPFVLVGNWL